MAPSKESQALKELFKTFASNFPADQNNFLERAVYDGVYKAGSEAMCVSYQSTTVAGRDAIWAKPVAASQKHVMLFMHGKHHMSRGDLLGRAKPFRSRRRL